MGEPFPHEEYANLLADIRDRLKLSLSEKAPEVGTPSAELAEQIKTLWAWVTVEAAPERAGRKAVRAQRPVTARIGDRCVEVPGPEMIAEAVPAVEQVTPVEPPAVVIPMPESFTLKADYRQAVVKRHGDGWQLSLF